MAEQRAQLLTYSAAATAACVSVSALCLAYSSLASGGPSKTHSSSDAHQQRAITINNYAASKDHTDENADEDGSSSSSSGPEAASSGSSSDKTSSDSTDKDKKDEKSEPRYKRVLQYWDQNEYAWMDREEKKLTPEEEEEAKKLFFTVKVRESRESDEDPEILVQFSSEPLRLALKDLIAKDVPEIYEEDPEINAHELFHKWDAIKDLAEEKAKAAADLDIQKKAGDNKVTMATQTTDGVFEASKQLAPSPEADKKKEVSGAQTNGPSEATTSTTTEIVATPPRQQAKNPTIEVVKRPQASASTPKRRKKRNLTLEVLKDQRDALQELLKFLDADFGKVKAKTARFKARGVMDYRTLWTAFPPHQIIVVPDEDSGEPIAFVVNSTEYVDSATRGKSFVLTGQHITWKNNKFVKTPISTSVKRFRGQRSLTALRVEPLSDARRKDLTARGREYVKYCGSYYMQYDGDLIVVSFSKFTGDKIVERENAKGRVMVDRESYSMLNPSAYGSSKESYYDDCCCDSCMASAEIDLEDDRLDEDVSDDEGDATPDAAPAAPPAQHSHSSGETIRILEEELCLLPPTHFGFSFALRMWGQLLVKFSDIQFDDQAFDQLVLDDLPKTAIRSLVDSTRRENYESSKLVTDLIQGKGGGLICVLFGSPGTGKTLTAEAVAERLQRPLYIVSSGQLGSDAGQLETGLQKTLELAERWDCVTLIDEADVFLEARSIHEMHRNALVAVFLKALERFHSTLFLTTNRVETFDPAFISRFSIAIKYSELDTSARKAIWRRFLDMAGVTIVPTPKKSKGLPNGDGPQPAPAPSAETPPAEDAPASQPTLTEKQLDTLAAAEINGRQVKQIVRSAQALALANKEPLAMSHCKTMLDFTKKFAAEFKHPGEIDYSAKDSSDQSRTHLYR